MAGQMEVRWEGHPVAGGHAVELLGVQVFDFELKPVLELVLGLGGESRSV
jgi:hypothetical protein